MTLGQFYEHDKLKHITDKAEVILALAPERWDQFDQLRPDVVQLPIIKIYNKLGTVILCPLAVVILPPVVGSINFPNA